MRLLKRLILIMMFGVATSLSAQRMPETTLLGHWWLGVLEEASLPINITWDVDNGEFKPVLYSPMQTPDPIIPTAWSFNNDTLNISHKPTGLRLTLVWNPTDTTFSGTFRQGMLRTQMRFVPADTLFNIVRPQTPKPPFPYSEREVTIQRRKAGVTLTGTLAIPEGRGPFPAVVLVSGSGQQNRDEELLGHKPFFVLSDYLARNGIAVLRYDDRGTGGSKGEVETATTLDFADDAEAVFDFLRRQKGIDSKRVGIIGHSEGGMIAPIVASRNRRVAFIALLAGPGTTGADILLQQNERLFQLDNVPQPLIERRLALLRSLFAAVDTLPIDNYQPFTIALCEKYSEGLTADQRKSIGLRRGDAIGLATQMALPWMRTFVKLDNSTYLKRLRCPILAVNGDRDSQVLPVNLDSIAAATGNRAKSVLLPGLNHLMQHCQTGASSEYMLIDETMAPEVMETVTSFVNSLK